MLAKVLFAVPALLAGLVAANPVPSSELVTRDNCTEYSSVSAGTVCVHRPSDCSALYTVQSGENCIELAQKFSNFSLSIFHYWNPDIGSNCVNLRAYVPYCINTPWYQYEGSIQPPPGTIDPVDSTPAIKQPFPIPTNTTASCNKYELAGDGVYVYNMVSDNGISYDDFYSWNPNTDNNVLIQNFWYCVGTSS